MTRHCFVRIYKRYEDDEDVVETIEDVPVPHNRIHESLAENKTYGDISEFHYLVRYHNLINAFLIRLLYASTAYFNNHHDKKSFQDAIWILRKIKQLDYESFKMLNPPFEENDLHMSPHVLAIYICLLYYEDEKFNMCLNK